jgi:hypothetical protein
MTIYRFELLQMGLGAVLIPTTASWYNLSLKGQLELPYIWMKKELEDYAYEGGWNFTGLYIYV